MKEVYALFPGGTIVRDSQHRKSLTHRGQGLNLLQVNLNESLIVQLKRLRLRRLLFEENKERISFSKFKDNLVALNRSHTFSSSQFTVE